VLKMKIKKLWFLVFVVGIILVGLFGGKQFFAKSIRGPDEGIGAIELPSPKHKGQVSVEEAIFNRRSIRRYKDGPLTLEEVSQLLWAAGGKTVDGVTGATRAYPSAGGIYPLEIYLIAGDVEGLTSGIYHYQWRDHSVALMEAGDVRKELTKAALGQGMVARAPMSLVFTAVYKRTTARYGRRGEARYVPMDMGGAGQNVHLQAEALGLGTVIIGAFNDEEVKKVLGIQDEEPLYIMPVGRI
jgi:SagB-type dehydrogenase family enzyme